jgi:hypothetical protein
MSAQHLRWVCLVGTLCGCASSRTAPDAGTSALDADSPEEDAPLQIEPNLDGRPGLGGGSSCDASEQCLSGACNLGICSDWSHAMRIGIDTTAAGANVGETVTGFPLLIRLNSDNFAFGEARLDGADIRFLDSSGNNLAYEIENWDPDAPAAEIWVLVPRIAGNSHENVIFMYWGNQVSPAASLGPSVFGNYSCVFHMGEDKNDAESLFENDSGHGNNATLSSPSGKDLRSPAFIGSGLALDGLSMLVAPRQLPVPKPMAIALWLKAQPTMGGGIASFTRDPSTSSGFHDRSVAMDSSGRLSFTVLHNSVLATVTSLLGYNDDVWHFVVARFSDSGQYLFVDGEAVADDPTMTRADSYSGYWRFGQEPSSPSDASSPTAPYFTGIIDEARISADEPSDAWIKLSYATQLPRPSAVIYPSR